MLFSLLPALAGGTTTAAAGAGTAAATTGGGLGGLLFGSAASGGAAATSGLFGAGGSFGLLQTAGTLGMGMGLMQAFGSQGSAPSTRVKLSREGKALQKNLYAKVKQQYETGLMPENLASIYIGKVKAQEGKTHKEARGFLTSMQGRSGGDINALLTETGRRREGLTAPAKWRISQKEQEFRNALAMMENLRNIERQTPLLRAQGQAYGALQSQAQSAAQGQALGDVAAWAALMKAYG